MARLIAALAAVAAALVLMVLGAGCGDDDGPASDGQDPGGTKVWFTAGEQFQTAEVDGKPGEVEPALDALLRGPGGVEAPAGTDTQIPAGTSLEGVNVSPDGTATVRLSKEFTQGIPDDPSARTAGQRQDLNARIGQVAYTATQFPDVGSTKVVAGGVPVEMDVSRSDYAAPPEGPKELSKPKGSKLPGIRQVQKKLAALGYLPKDAVDGLNGYRTQQAVMAFQSWEGLGRDGVVGPRTSAALATARRPSPSPGGPPKRIEVYIQKGVTLLIKGGRVRRSIHSSAGAPGTDTPTGRYRVFRKELRSWSVPFQTWLPYASYFNNGIAFHEYPDVPPYPASHGCVRIPAPEAPGVYDFAAVGTTVAVYR